MLPKVLTRLLWFAVLVTAPSAWASDGVLEISQACAINGGCFDGDTTGFPVTITKSGSYRLTSNLDLSGLAPVTAVQIESPAVHLNLGGFEIIGPTTCTGSGATISCNPTGTGHGVEVYSASIASSVRNGTVRGFGNNGISANPQGLRISDVTAMHNGNDGFSNSAGVMIESCVAMENGGDGFDGDAGSVFNNLMAMGNGINGIEIDNVGGVVFGSASQGSGARGFNIAALSKFGHDNVSHGNFEVDNCGGGLCTEKQRYYLTAGRYFGSEALSACAEGFHMATLMEIWNPTNLSYDVRLGFTLLDSGSGPPYLAAGYGWIRTGSEGITSTSCGTWTSNDYSGPAIRTLGYFRWQDAFSSGETLNFISPWEAAEPETLPCDVQRHVWCVEN